MKINNEMNNKSPLMRNKNPQKKSKYNCIFHCPITINDSINSIDLLDDKVIIGTLMGDVYLCRVDDSKLSKKSIKNIIPPLNFKTILEKDDSNIQINNNNINNNIDCIKLAVKGTQRNNNTINSDILNMYNFETNKQNIKIADENDNNPEKDKIINFPKITQLINRSRENIPCLEFESSDIINICIGDLEIIHLENMSTFNKNDKNSTYNFSKLRNYKTENDHIEFCETATCFLKNSCFLLIFTKFAEFEEDLEIAEVKYENKNLYTGDIIKGVMKLSNYVVPFDFNGDMFLFVDYISKEQKFIGIEYTISKNKRFVYYIRNMKNFGHISHMKLMSNERIFLVRNEIECEIRYINDDLDIIEKFDYIGEEIISCYFYKSDSINSFIEILDDIDYRENGENNNDELNKSGEEKMEKNIKKFFENKNDLINLKNKEKTTFINSNVTVNIHNKSRMRKIQNQSQNNLTIYGEKKKIFFSVDDQIKKNNSLLCTETSNKKKESNLKLNSNSVVAPFLNKSNTRKNSNGKINYYSIDNKIIDKTNSLIKYNVFSEEKKKELELKMNNFSSIEIFGKKYLRQRMKNMKIENEDQTIIKHSERHRGYNIIFLDNNGTVFLYHNNSQINLFNIYDINNIKQKYKNINFFSLGFPYYIMANEKYFCITTDFGLFVFTKNNE